MNTKIFTEWRTQMAKFSQLFSSFLVFHKKSAFIEIAVLIHNYSRHIFTRGKVGKASKIFPEALSTVASGFEIFIGNIYLVRGAGRERVKLSRRGPTTTLLIHWRTEVKKKMRLSHSGRVLLKKRFHSVIIFFLFQSPVFLILEE